MRESLILLLCFAGLAIAHRARADDAADAARERALALLRLSAPPPAPPPVPTPVPTPVAGPSELPVSLGCIDGLPEARAKAIAEQRPLLIWVGGCTTVDKAVRGAFPDAVHCHCDSLNGSDEHRLLIPLREGAYAVFSSEKLTEADVPDIRRAIERAPAKVSANAVQAVPVQSFGDCPDGSRAMPPAFALPSQGVRFVASTVQCATGR